MKVTVFSPRRTNVLITPIVRKWNRLKEALQMFPEHDYFYLCCRFLPAEEPVKIV